MQPFICWSPLRALAAVLFISVCGFVEQIGANGNVPAIFYPFGRHAGDTIGPHNDDTCTAEVPIDVGFPFFNSTRRSLYVGTNGVVSFGGCVRAYVPEPFPTRSASLVAAWWSDIDMECTGNMYYRQTTDETLLERATQDVLHAVRSHGFYFFRARWVFIVTWHDVTYYRCAKRNQDQSVQAVLVTDGKYSFAILNYGTLTWAGNAQVGFNAGDGIKSEVVVGSRTANITEVASLHLSNVGVKGRLVYRIDDVIIRPPSDPINPDCGAWQNLTNDECIDVAPPFSNVTLSDPIEFHGEYLEFHCSWTANASDAAARFEVTFLFDDTVYDDVPRQNLTAAEPRLAVLHERYLHGKLGKWLSCRVKSLWVDTPSVVSKPLGSNPYRLAIETEGAVYSMSVRENDPKPTRLVLRSTLPITCQSVNSVDGCGLELKVSVSGNGIAVRQNHPMSVCPACSYVIMNSDWKPQERLAYDSKVALEVTAKVDPLITAPRVNRIHFQVRIRATEQMKSVGGQTYMNPWDGYVIEPDILVYRSDSPQAVCTASGDPHITTFDGFYYSTYFTGQFIYVRSIGAKIPFEVHMRHWECWPTVACVCGVALREDTTILALDMCNKTDRIPRLIRNKNITELPAGANITITKAGHTFKIEMPSGNKAIVHYHSWGLSTQLFVYAKFRTEGLCGSFDGNAQNDLVVRDNGTVMMTLSKGQPHPAVVESWRLPQHESLFDEHLAVLPPADAEDCVDPDVSGGGGKSTPFCSCNTYDKDPICGLAAVSDNRISLLVDPSIPVNTKVMKTKRSPSSSEIESRPREVLGRIKRDDTAAAGEADHDGVTAERSDDIDYSYDPGAFDENQQMMITIDWPTWNGITESAARTGCIERILNVANIGPDCLSSLVSTNVTDIIVQKCVDDVQITGDFEWASDKVTELQQMCIYAVISRNYSDVNDVNETEPHSGEETEALVAELHSIVRRHLQSMTSHMCEPFDCGGRGSCRNGSCVCYPGFTGLDCTVNTSAVPSIVYLLNSADCNIRRRLCQSLSMVVSNVDRTKVKCKVVIVKMDSTADTFVTSAEMTSLNTLTCSLPVEPLSLYTVNMNLSALHEPGFEFNSLPLGGAVLRYSVSLSNDGEQYGEGKTMRIVDSLCMTCDGDNCQQKDGTCLINGYCFLTDDANPYNNYFECQPQMNGVIWTRTAQNTLFPIIVAALSSLLAVSIIAVIFAMLVTVRNLKRKKLVFDAVQ